MRRRLSGGASTNYWQESTDCFGARAYWDRSNIDRALTPGPAIKQRALHEVYVGYEQLK
jgi:hypothetical protein